MANCHISYVFNSSDAKGADRLMLLAIADYCDEHGTCYPSYEKLAQKCNVTRRTAITTCQRLQASGHLYIAQNEGYKTKAGITNRFYMLKWRESQGIDNSTLITGDTDDTSDTDITPRGDTDDTPRGDTDITQSLVVSQDKSQDKKTLSPPVDDKPKKQRPPDLIFNTIAEIAFNIRDVKKIGATGGRIGKVKKALIASYPSIKPEDLRKFKFWYTNQFPRTPLPRDDKKFLEHYTSFNESFKPATSETPSPRPLNISARAAS